MRKYSLLILLITALSFWSCAPVTSQNYSLGTQAEVNKNWDEAIAYYEKAIAENPKDYTYKLSLTRVRVSASLSHLREARSLLAEGKKDEATKEYQKAIYYDPTNRGIVEEMRRALQPPAQKEEPIMEKLGSAAKLKVGPEKIELKFTEASLRSIFQALGKHAQINIIFDELFKDMPLSIDLSGKEFEEAVGYLCLASKNFYRVIDEKTIIIVPDQPVKRIQYEQNAIMVFQLSNINAQDIFAALQQMLRTQYRAPNIFVDKTLNTVTVRDTPANLELAANLIKKWDKPKGEIVIDLEIMEVSRQKLKSIGLDLQSELVGLRYAGPGAVPGEGNEGWYNLGELALGAASSYQISLPTAYFRFLATDSDTKVLAQPRLRGVSDEEIETMIGQQVPIPQTTFTPIAAGGVNQQPVTSFTYQDVGFKIKIKPRLHVEGEITLEVELELTSIAGPSSVADIPIIATRKVKNILRLRDGETNLLAGLLRDEERKALRGIAGLTSIPFLGSLFGVNNQTIEKTELILTITPFIIRSVPRSAEDRKPLWIQLEGVSPVGRGEQSLEEEGLTPEEIAEREAAMGQEEEQPAEEPGEEPAEEPGESQVSLDPANFEVPQGREFRISVNLRTQREVGNLSLNLSFNPQVVKLKDVIEGDLTQQMGGKVPFLKNIDNSGGGCTIGFSSPQANRGFQGGGSLAVLVCEAAAQGETSIAVSGVSANAPTGQPVRFTSRDSRVAVR